MALFELRNTKLWYPLPLHWAALLGRMRCCTGASRYKS